MCARNNPQKFDKGTERFRNKRTNGDYSDYNILKIGRNRKKSPGELRRLALTQTPVEDNQLTLVWKTLREWIIIKSGPGKEIKKTVEHDSNCNSYAWNGSQKLGKGTGKIGNQRKNQDYRLEYCWNGPECLKES